MGTPRPARRRPDRQTHWDGRLVKMPQELNTVLISPEESTIVQMPAVA
jgi:hypothetical protein